MTGKASFPAIPKIGMGHLFHREQVIFMLITPPSGWQIRELGLDLRFLPKTLLLTEKRSWPWFHIYEMELLLSALHGG